MKNIFIGNEVLAHHQMATGLPVAERSVDVATKRATEI
jgi:hypothetical protein